MNADATIADLEDLLATTRAALDAAYQREIDALERALDRLRNAKERAQAQKRATQARRDQATVKHRTRATHTSKRQLTQAKTAHALASDEVAQLNQGIREVRGALKQLKEAHGHFKRKERVIAQMDKDWVAGQGSEPGPTAQTDRKRGAQPAPRRRGSRARGGQADRSASARGPNAGAATAEAAEATPGDAAQPTAERENGERGDAGTR